MPSVSARQAIKFARLLAFTAGRSGQSTARALSIATPTKSR
jgi:hypothetical protein